MSASESSSSSGDNSPASSAPRRAAASGSVMMMLDQKELARLLEVRRQIKRRTPKFRRFESWRYVRIDEPWRKPKGIDNHMRLSVKGWPHLVKIGYRVPKQVRNLHPSGLRDQLVHNMSELEALTPNVDAARLAATVGRRKKIELARRAKELGIRVLNGKSLAISKERKEDGAEESEKKKKGNEQKRSILRKRGKGAKR